jgi:hypothetical protein
MAEILHQKEQVRPMQLCHDSSACAYLHHSDKHIGAGLAHVAVP